MLQYYVSYGWWGIAGAAVNLLVMPLTAMTILQSGSYSRAQSHGKVSHSITSLFLPDFMDYGLSIAPFYVGFVMFAGSGFNLNQQFGLPLWTDSAIMVVLVPLMTGALLLSIQDVYDADLPTLALIDEINPVLGSSRPWGRTS